MIEGRLAELLDTRRLNGEMELREVLEIAELTVVLGDAECWVRAWDAAVGRMNDGYGIVSHRRILRWLRLLTVVLRAVAVLGEVSEEVVADAIVGSLVCSMLQKRVERGQVAVGWSLLSWRGQRGRKSRLTVNVERFARVEWRGSREVPECLKEARRMVP